MGLHPKPTIRSRAPLLNSTGVFELRNSDCECTCIAPMSLTAGPSGLNRPRGILRPLQVSAPGSSAALRHVGTMPAGAPSVAGTLPHDPHLPRATRPQRKRCGRQVSARHHQRLAHAADRARSEPAFARRRMAARAQRDAGRQPRWIGLHRRRLACPSRNCSRSKHPRREQAQSDLTLLSGNPRRGAQRAARQRAPARARRG
jgi:hypothetical protein